MKTTSFSKLCCFVLLTISFYSTQIFSQRPMEFLDRSLVVQERSGGGTFLTWRMLGTDPRDVSFNIYRNGTRINSSPITQSTNFTDNQGSINAQYRLETIIEGGENEFTEKAHRFPLSDVPGRARIPIKRIPLDPPVLAGEDYLPGNMSVGDLTGDGTYELIIEWESMSGINGFLEAIDLDGNRLWRIFAGPNTNSNKLNFMVYDFNMNGRAEVIFMTGPGTVDGRGNPIRRGPAANYPSNLVIERGWGNNLLHDPQFITVFDGLTGEEMATSYTFPSIGPIREHNRTWGDDRGHRASSLKGAVLYTQEHGPIYVFQRGVYTRIGLSAFRWDGANELTEVWRFDTEDPANPGNRAYRGQGNHSVSVGDLDEDGNDELIIGAAAIDHDGTGMWVTGHGHGDANHLGKHIPDRPGMQFFMPHEDNRHGLSMVDVRTGEVIWYKLSPADVGRAWAADVDPRFRGSEVVAIGFPNYDNLGNEIPTSYNAYHQPIYFDGETVRGRRVSGWGIESYRHGRILTGWHYGAAPIHGTKENANLVADILGDWREEVIFRNSNNRELIIFTSWFPTERKNPTLMHDPTYRMNIANQNVGYNQPAHTGYYFRDGFPDHDIYIIGQQEVVCDPTAITPHIRVEGQAWNEASQTTIERGMSLTFGPHPHRGGSWSWSGCGTTGETREQTVSPQSTCVATATYTNSCGAVSTHEFNVRVEEPTSTTIFNEQNTHLITVFPNPAKNGFFTIQLPNNINESLITIYNVSGNSVFNKKANGNSIEVSSNLKNGVYFISVKTAQKEIIKQITVID